MFTEKSDQELEADVQKGKGKGNGKGKGRGKGKAAVKDEKRTRGRGRLDADKQPAKKQPQIIAERLDELVELQTKAKAATERAADAITKAAEDSGYLASAVRKLVTAKAGDKFEEKHREVEQQGELFNEVAG